MSFLDKETIDAVSSLASAFGVPGAALLIITIGIAIKIDKLGLIVKGIIKDFHDHSRKSRELDHRIKRDSDAIGLEIARKHEQVVKRIERKPGK
ncbi:hypothetical protein QEV83_05190 [Methylocapsa sp. D3K7]|uniref:hypothetical protein n=1 Tax=Methylocapsa sp. D3K7 TaxID=3041435 RepID=UPI00244E5C2E|nr:hypothetical protein [Methylocapsa sp. D3K7]WGJ15660.1 hypothetical protein QEV83_05190 [Methylocapsa sp. D3K7]